MKFFNSIKHQANLAGQSLSPDFVSQPSFASATPPRISNRHKRQTVLLISFAVTVLLLVVAVFAYREYSAPVAPGDASQPSSQPVKKH